MLSLPRADHSSRLPASTGALLWLLWFLALALRLPGVWLVANAHGDAYSYAETIGAMSAKLSAHNFAFADLFGFWLPLYQFVSAVLASTLGLDPMLAGKLVSAVCGAGCAVLVFGLTVQVTQSRSWAWLAFALLLLDPAQLFLSSLSMTEASHSFLVLALLHYASRSRWRSAALCAALAGLVRVDSWLFVLILPALQYLRERRVSPVALACLASGPALWLAISFAARGDALAYFTERARYVAAYLEYEPARRTFSYFWQDAHYLVAGAHTVVFPLALIACALLAAQFSFRETRESEQTFSLVVLATCFCGMLAFLVAAYVSRSQPVLWSRYGAIYFLTGLPLAAWTAQTFATRWSTRPRLRTAVAVVLAVACLAHALWQGLLSILPAIADDGAHARIAQEIRRRATDEGWSGPPAKEEISPFRCFCDDPAVRVLSRLPPARFLRTENHRTVSSLTDFLRQNQTPYLVFAAIENSLPATLAPELARPNGIPATFELVRFEPSPGRYGPDVLLYRLRP